MKTLTISKSEALKFILGENDSNKASVLINGDDVRFLWNMQIGNLFTDYDHRFSVGHLVNDCVAEFDFSDSMKAMGYSNINDYNSECEKGEEIETNQTYFEYKNGEIRIIEDEEEQELWSIAWDNHKALVESELKNKIDLEEISNYGIGIIEINWID